jgi:uncharacterized repeat protein (TIGR01451 family)
MDIECDSNYDCGSSGYTGSAFCSSGDVYKRYTTYTCNNAGTSSSYCSSSNENKLFEDCSSSQTCSNGSCEDQDIECDSDYDCGSDGYTGSNFCQNGDVYRKYKEYTCYNAGSSNSYCSSNTQNKLIDNCDSNEYCNNGYCEQDNNNCGVDHYERRCSGPYAYWYNNCGQMKDLIQYCSNGCSNGYCNNDNNNGYVSITKQVRNMTSGGGFSTSTYANPGDTLMFMITIDTNGGDATNVRVQDTLSSRLQYSDNMIISGSSNYSGDIISGITFNTVRDSDYITITYLARVASVDNFGYGTNTETSNTSVSGSNLQYQPNQSASVYVTRTAVLGDTTISTGLTNNFLTDSFLLPLLVALAGIWMFKAGMFINLEKWFDNKRKQRNGRKAAKELQTRIERIQKTENI